MSDQYPEDAWRAPTPADAPTSSAPPAAPHTPDTWTSPLWGRPDTVGGYWRSVSAPDVVQVPPVPPAGPSRRSLALVASVVALALVLVAAAVTGIWRSGGDTTATPPPAPSLGALPSPLPSPPATAPSPQPSTGQRPGQSQQPGNGQQGTALTPQQQAAAASVSPGLVDVLTRIGYGGERGAGTGIVLSADGLVLTNHHVVVGATSIEVTDIGNGKTYTAKVLGYDGTHDVAVLQLQGASGLTVAPQGDSSTVQVGDDVVAIGNAGGVGGTPSAVAGPVTALDQQISVRDEMTGQKQRLTGLMEFSAAIRQGDSGGAVVDDNATVVGMITAASIDNQASDVAVATTGYAIPLAQAMGIAQQIIDGHSSGTVHVGDTAFLGVQLADAQLGQGGVLVAGVVDGSAAARAGIVAGDTVTAVGGRSVGSADQLRAAISAHRPGDSVTVTWTDGGGNTHTKSVSLGSGPVG
jgi:S1-C subfamily serine protease